MDRTANKGTATLASRGRGRDSIKIERPSYGHSDKLGGPPMHEAASSKIGGHGGGTLNTRFEVPERKWKLRKVWAQEKDAQVIGNVRKKRNKKKLKKGKKLPGPKQGPP